MKYIITVILIFFSTFASGQTFDSCAFYKRQNDTLRQKLYMETKKLNKLVFYIDIVIKKHSQVIFLNSWKTRTLKSK